jgi:histidinol-phosphate aminotransferase
MSVYERNANTAVRALRPYIPGPTAGEIRDRYGIPLERIVKLSSNEAPLGPSPKVREALRRTSEGDDLHRYPSSSLPQLREAIAKVLGVQPDQVLPATGSSSTWPLIVRAFSHAGDPVLWIDPSFTAYAEVAILAEREERSVRIVPPFDVDAGSIAAAARGGAKVVFLSSPNNTTSRFADPEVVRELAEGAPDTVVVVDEHYIEAVDDFRSRTAVTLVDSIPNLIVTRSFSKMYGLAGLRVGYAVASEEAVTSLATFRPSWSVNVVAEAAARAALEDEEHLERNIEATRTGRAFLDAALRSMDAVEVAPDPQGGFLLFRPLLRPADEVTEGLFGRGVMVRGDLLEGWIRVSVGTQDQNTAFLEALDSALTG